MQYQKTAVVEAAQFDGNVGDTTLGVYADPMSSTGYAIDTRRGKQEVVVNDYIVVNPDGERYPVRPDVFEQTYNEVKDDAGTQPATQGAPVPTVGRTVHYKSYGTPGGEFQPECRAAVITAVNPQKEDVNNPVSLCVMNPTGNFFNNNVPQDEVTKSGGTWHWPERV